MPFRESFRVFKSAMATKQLWLTYTFEELNMTTFQNAYAWQLKNREPDVRITAVAPSRFIDLYSCADSRRAMPDSFVSNYAAIQSYSEFRYSGWQSNESFTVSFIQRILFAAEVAPQWLFRRLPPIVYHRVPFKLRAHGRSRVFYLESGYRRMIMKQLPSRLPLLESTSNFNTETLGFGPAHNQARFFNEGFKTLAAMIRTGNGYSREYLENVLTTVPENLIGLQRDEFGIIVEFLEKNPKTILLRTRNKSIATSNNASAANLDPFIRSMSSEGYAILNVGAPALIIEHPSVQNLSHNLPPALLMALGMRFDYVATSCGGDFFTGWACVPYPITVFDTEWSIGHLPDSPSLLAARRVAGIEDYRIAAKGLHRSRD
jgi:hypothetical protein